MGGRGDTRPRAAAHLTTPAPPDTRRGAPRPLPSAEVPLVACSPRPRRGRSGLPRRDRTGNVSDAGRGARSRAPPEGGGDAPPDGAARPRSRRAERLRTPRARCRGASGPGPGTAPSPGAAPGCPGTRSPGARRAGRRRAAARCTGGRAGARPPGSAVAGLVVPVVVTLADLVRDRPEDRGRFELRARRAAPGAGAPSLGPGALRPHDALTRHPVGLGVPPRRPRRRDPLQARRLVVRPRPGVVETPPAAHRLLSPDPHVPPPPLHPGSPTLQRTAAMSVSDAATAGRRRTLWATRRAKRDTPELPLSVCHSTGARSRFDGGAALR